LPEAAASVEECQAPLVRSELKDLDPPLDVAEDIEAIVVDEPPPTLREGGVVRAGVDAELDSLREISHGGRTTIAAIEERERARTGITNLKVRFNRVFGYYIEVSKSNLGAIPDDYIRKQTIAGASASSPRAEGVRGEGPQGGRAHGAREGDRGGPAGAGRGPGPPHPGLLARAGHPRHPGRAGRGVLPVQH
jgi:hypothetical protein